MGNTLSRHSLSFCLLLLVFNLRAPTACGQVLYGGAGLLGTTQPFGLGLGLRGYFQPSPHLRLAGLADGVLALGAPQTSYALRGGVQMQGLLPLPHLTAYIYVGGAYRYYDYWVYLPLTSGPLETQHLVSLSPMVLGGLGLDHRQGRWGFAVEYELNYPLEASFGWGHQVSFYLMGPFATQP